MISRFMFALYVINIGVICIQDARAIVLLMFVKFVKKRIVKKADLSTPSLSPITTECDPVIAKQLFDSLPNLRSLHFEEQLLPDQWKELLEDNFTHLHTTDDNIFSPNKATSQPVNGIFLSFHTLCQLLNNNNCLPD